MKSVLFITYYFPPSGGSGVQRPLKFVKYLAEFGWKVTVLTVDPQHAAYSDLDRQLGSDIPKQVKVVRTRSWDPYSVYARWVGKSKQEAVGVGFLGAEHASSKEKLARWVRANLFLPDARVGWVKYAKKAGSKLLKQGGFDAIVSTGPPHSCHLIAVYLSKKYGIPWVADVRDAWPDMAYAEMLPTSQWARKRDIKLRNKTLAEARACIAVTQDLRNTMQQEVGIPFELIRNGFDPADFEDLDPVSSTEFTLVHTGTMAPARNPHPLWKLLSSSKSRDRWAEMKVVFVGNVDSTVWDSVKKVNATDWVDHITYVPHKTAIRYTLGASLLLLPINRVSDAAGIVTGKIYEYIASGRPILGLGDPKGEAATILKETGAGQMFDYEDLDAIGEFIDEHYRAWVSGRPLSGANSEHGESRNQAENLESQSGPKSAAAFSRRTQTGELAAILNRVSEVNSDSNKTFSTTN